MDDWKEYIKPATQKMRPYVIGEDLSKVSVSKSDTPEEGGMIAINIDNPEDMWYVGKKFFTANYVEAETSVLSEKTLHNSDISGTKVNVPDVKVVGNGDMFQLLCKASSKREGWMKSTKAMEIPGVGCLVQVSTQQKAPDGSYAVAEALVFVPDVTIATDSNSGRKLRSQD